MIRSKQIIFLNFILLQMFLSCFIGLSYLNLNIFNWYISTFVVFATVVILGGLCIWTVKELLRLVKKEHEAETAAARLEENKALVRALKVKQHDFANHIQVIHGMIYQGKTDQVKKYMKDITADLKVLDRLTGLKSPELAALISKKMTMSDMVKVDPVIETDLARLSVPGDKMVSILGNLLDNAIFAELNSPSKSNKKVSLKIWGEEGNYLFQVWNPEPIPVEIQDKIFQAGFTTKGDQGSGMGLHIVQSLVSEYKGSLELTSDPESGTNFTITLPVSMTSENEAS